MATPKRKWLPWAAVDIRGSDAVTGWKPVLRGDSVGQHRRRIAVAAACSCGKGSCQGGRVSAGLPWAAVDIRGSDAVTGWKPVLRGDSVGQHHRRIAVAAACSCGEGFSNR